MTALGPAYTSQNLLTIGEYAIDQRPRGLLATAVYRMV